jgi:hypothetical protein
MRSDRRLRQREQRAVFRELVDKFVNTGGSGRIFRRYDDIPDIGGRHRGVRRPMYRSSASLQRDYELLAEHLLEMALVPELDQSKAPAYATYRYGDWRIRLHLKDAAGTKLDGAVFHWPYLDPVRNVAVVEMFVEDPYRHESERIGFAVGQDPSVIKRMNRALQPWDGPPLIGRDRRFVLPTDA